MKLSDDDFALFDLPRRQSLDRAVLDQRWRDLQAQVHPDRHAAAGPAAQRVAMQWAVRVNEAYQRLKQPLTRAAYLCELLGQPVSSETRTAMPADFLVQQMSWREELEQADTPQALDRLGNEVQRDEAERFARLTQLLDTEQGDVQAAAALVRELMFMARFRQELDRRTDALDHPI